MASNNLSISEEECTCPVCCEIFKDPVILQCGHSFCLVCLQEWWRQNRCHKCPVCMEIFPLAYQPPRNLALRNLSDNLRRERSQRQRQSVKPAAEELCSEHGEKLKLFCEDDQQLICVICRDAKKHKKHNCSPINEAAEAYRKNLFKPHLMTLKTKLDSFHKAEVLYDQMSNHIANQAQQTEKTITEEFQKLYQFLRAEETARIDALRKEAKSKSEAMNIRKINLNAEMSSLTNKIEIMEMEMKSADVTFLLNINSTMKTAEWDLPEPETPPSESLIDEGEHVENVQFKVWSKMRDIIKYPPGTLDANTGFSRRNFPAMTRAPRRNRLQLLRETGDLNQNEPNPFQSGLGIHSPWFTLTRGSQSGRHSES
ncbi:uncharacterized protein V6R79_013416 [Siganus canaliculatus]